MKQIKYLMIILSFLYPWIVLFAQYEEKNSNKLRCKDLLKYKEQIINSYLANSTIQENEKVLTEIYLDCGIHSLVAHYSCSEIAALSFINLGDIKKILDTMNEKASRDFDECYKEKQGLLKFSNLGEFGYTILFKSCIDNIISTDSIYYEDIDEDTFCDCYANKIIDKNFTYAYYINEFFDELVDESSVSHNEIYLNCYYNSMKKEEDINHSRDISGPSLKEEIDILDVGSRKIKILLGDHVKYFDLDTGAEETVITMKMAELLEKDGLISKYLDDKYFVLADGTEADCKQMIINNFKIGNFTVNNVTVAVPKEAEGSFLLGLSFLNKFKWSIDAERSVLLLEKK